MENYYINLERHEMIGPSGVRNRILWEFSVGILGQENPLRRSPLFTDYALCASAAKSCLDDIIAKCS